MNRNEEEQRQDVESDDCSDGDLDREEAERLKDAECDPYTEDEGWATREVWNRVDRSMRLPQDVDERAYKSGWCSGVLAVKDAALETGAWAFAQGHRGVADIVLATEPVHYNPRQTEAYIVAYRRVGVVGEAAFLVPGVVVVCRADGLAGQVAVGII